MKTFRDILNENTAGLYGFYDDSTKTLKIVRPNGQIFNVKSSILDGRRIFGVSTVGDQIVVYVGPMGNPQPLTAVKFSNSGIYMGSTNLTN